MKRALMSLALMLALPCLCCNAQRWSAGTNLADWLTLGTVNAEASVAVARNVSVHVGAEMNPWTFRAGDREKQAQLRQISYWTGAKWWPWHIYSGWWTGADIRYTVYNEGGLLKRETEEGDAFGGGIYGGYAIMLNDRWNLDLGIGLWGGYKTYTVYACPLCGVTLESGEKAFVKPDARVALQMIF